MLLQLQKWTIPSLVPRPSHHPISAYCSCKQSKTGQWEGLGYEQSWLNVRHVSLPWRHKGSPVGSWLRMLYSTSRGSHLCVACRNFSDHGQVFRSLYHSLPRLFIAWFPRVKGQNAAMHSWLLILAVQRSPWSLDRPPQKGFDRLIQFWSWSQRLLHGTYKWLPLLMDHWSVCSLIYNWHNNATSHFGNVIVYIGTNV